MNNNRGLYIKDLFERALENKDKTLLHRRARGSAPLCGREDVPLRRQTLQDEEVTCGKCAALLDKLGER